MASDFYTDAAAQRMAEIEAGKAQALADLQSAKATGDSYLASQSVQTLANLNAEANNLAALHSQYQASLNPPRPPEPSKEERAARRWDQMTYDDALSLVRDGSKYGRDLTHDDPAVQAGYRHVASRRSRGE